MTKKLLVITALMIFGLGITGCQHTNPRYSGTISYGWDGGYYGYSGYRDYPRYHRHRHHHRHWYY